MKDLGTPGIERDRLLKLATIFEDKSQGIVEARYLRVFRDRFTKRRDSRIMPFYLFHISTLTEPSPAGISCNSLIRSYVLFGDHSLTPSV